MIHLGEAGEIGNPESLLEYEVIWGILVFWLLLFGGYL